MYSRGELSDGAESLAREATTAVPEDQHFAFIAAFILLSRGKWQTATEPARRLITADDKFHARNWRTIAPFFADAARLGRAADARALLAESDIGERWRPLAEALRAAEEGTRAVLTQVAPEIRHPAEALLDQFGIDLPG